MNKKTEKGKKSFLDYIDRSGNKFIPLEEYKSYYTKILVECSCCGFQDSKSPRVIQDGIDCSYCCGKLLDVERVQEFLDDLGKKIEVVSVHGTKGKFNCRCRECGHEWSTTKSVISKNKEGNSACPCCNMKLKGSVEKLEQLFREYGHKVRVVGEYVNNSTPVETQCLSCHKPFYPIPTSVLYGSGCPNCCFKGRIPKGPATLYYMRVDFDDKSFWKIGITTKENPLDRYTSTERKRLILLFSHKFEDGLTAYVCEKNILRLYSDYRADTSALYSGNTELFTKDVLQLNHLTKT